MATDVIQDRLAGTWNFVPVHSAATFSVKYLVAPFRGEFTDLRAQLADGRLTGAVRVASVSVKDENLVAHLQSPDFFDAEQHPEISFSSDRLDIDGDRVTLTGELTMKGVTRPVTASGTISGPTEDYLGNTRLGLSLEAVVDRTAHGVSWNAALPKGGDALGSDVKIAVELEFHRA
jgi:polyisoprenoid-binding protein YceI